MTGPNELGLAGTTGGRSTDPLLQVEDLEVHYRRPGWRAGEVKAVRGVGLEVPRGRTVGLVGESGSGKSTIGAAILGLTHVSAGRIAFDGQDITRPSSSERRLLARRMQVIFQDPYGSMNPARTVGETITESLKYNLGASAAETMHRLSNALNDVGLDADAADRFPAQFSGGQRQRIAIARALVMDPDFIVCDEPTSALDLSVQAQIINVLGKLKQDRNLSYLFISHDLAIVRHMSDEIVVLYAGKVVERGPAADVAKNPVHPYTRALVAAAPVPDPSLQAQRRDARRTLKLKLTPSGASGSSTGCDFAPRCPFATDRCRTTVPVLEQHGSAWVACLRKDEIPPVDDVVGAVTSGAPDEQA